MSIVMTGGGTGGHLAIIRAVKEAMAEDQNPRHSGLDPESHGHPEGILNRVQDDGALLASLVYIGSTQGQDQKWFADDEDFGARYFLETKGVVNQRGIGKLGSLWMLFKAFLQARKLLKKHQASVVFSVGGFSAAATAFAAKSMGIPLVIHEQNVALGSLNKLLRPYAAEFISSYLDESPVHAYPIKQIFFDKARIRDRVQTVIFIGGSQGAVAINTLALELAPILHKRGIRIIHQAGERNIEATRKAYEDLGIDAEVFGFTDRLVEYMTEADLAIARAGASTLWELSANALPTLFIPFPYAASDHQYHNAQFLVEKDLAWLMRESEIDTREIVALLEEDMAAISRGLMAAIEPDGAKQIAEMLSRF
jgi:UDP-N-acetylglucosamine--N-acetylmuramyl-(pentapeptide) pyrophosphoryl-undecaprenol N-acetylglucosamine transferase